tara:strand:+ start:347 stop:730 length:384 start_codon:yes stop_codon:yes gene_type:complete
MKNSITVFDKLDAPSTAGTSLVSKLEYGIMYNDLVDLLGSASFEGSSDGKVNFEWVVEFESENGTQLFTVYDWKTESPEWSMLNTGGMEEAKSNFGSRWHVGGKEYAGDFVEYLETEIKKVRTELTF